MTYELYRNIYFIAMVIAIAFLLISIILFIVLKIPDVIGLLSGRTQKKAIKNIKEKNQNIQDTGRNVAGIRVSKTGTIMPRTNTSGLGLMTEKISTQTLGGNAGTSIIGNETILLDANANQTMVLQQNNETMVLNQNNETMVLAQNNGNMVSTDIQNGTTVLNNEMINAGFYDNSVSEMTEYKDFVIEYDITYINTDVVIS